MREKGSYYEKRTNYSILLLAVCILLNGCSPAEHDSHPSFTVTTSLEHRPTLIGNIPCSFPLTTEPDSSLNILSVGYDNTNLDDVYVLQKYEQMTGVHINWTTVSKEQRKELVNTSLMNHNPLDLIMRCKISSSQLVQYGESGYIYDLAKDDMLKKYAPNCWAFLESHPDALASIMNPDGSIYALPQINSSAELRVARKLFINKTWLKNVKKDVPTTTEEFYQLLQAFQKEDANGNGDPNDEIPLCSQDWISIQDAFYGSFGLADRGVYNQLVDWDEDTSAVRLIPAAKEYRDFLEYLNCLYSENLLDHNIFSMTMEQWTNHAENDRIGVFANTNLATLPADKADNWIAVKEPLEGPDGDKLCSSIRANFHSTGAAVIPTTCQNPALVLKWLDYFWTDEGSLFYHMGIENETFLAKQDETYDYVPSIYEEMKKGSKSFDDVIAAYSPYPGGGNPTVEIAPYFRGGEMAEVPANAARKLFQYGPPEYWPSFTFTAAENERLDILQSDITKYYTTARIDFVTGATPFSEWDAYENQLDLLGKEELLQIYQAAVDRYHELTARSSSSYSSDGM